MTKEKSFYTKYFPIILLAGIIIGSIIGIVMGEKATVLKPLGDIFLNLMFTIVVPMVFVSITSAVGSMVDLKRLGKIISYTLLIFIITGLIAAFFVLVTVNIFPLKANIPMGETTAVELPSSPGEMLVSTLTVSDFGELFSKSNMLPLIIFAILFGLAMSICGGKESPVGKFFINLNDIIMKIVDIIMKVAPIGLGAYFANLVGELGPQLLGDYARVLAIYYPLVFFYMIVMFPLYAYFAAGKNGVKIMSKHIIPPAITAFATQSSVAALPSNKEASDAIGIPKDISNIVLPMGTTMHMDGSVISSIIKISFLFALFDMPFEGLATYAIAIVVSILAAFVLSGAPGGGLVGEMLIVTLFNFPPEAFPIIATIGFLVDPPATMLNSSGDTIASMMVARLIEGKDWLDKKLENAEE